MAPRYGFVGEIAEFTRIGTDVPQPGVNYGPSIVVGGVVWAWNNTTNSYHPTVVLRYNSFAALNAALPPSAALNGVIAEYGRIVGSGYARAKCNGTRWATMMGQSPVMLANPFSVEPVANTNSVDTALFSAPGNLFGVDEEWELALPSDIRTNMGTDTIASVVAGAVLLAQSIGPQSFGACCARFVLASTTSMRRTFTQTSATARLSIPIDATGVIDFIGRYTPTTIGSAVDCRMVRLTRIG